MRIDQLDFCSAAAYLNRWLRKRPSSRPASGAPYTMPSRPPDVPSPLQFLQSLVLLVDSSLLVSESRDREQQSDRLPSDSASAVPVPMLPRLVLAEGTQVSVCALLPPPFSARSFGRRDDALKGAVPGFISRISTLAHSRAGRRDRSSSRRRFAHKCAPGDRAVEPTHGSEDGRSARAATRVLSFTVGTWRLLPERAKPSMAHPPHSVHRHFAETCERIVPDT